MAHITLSVSEDIYEEMKRHPEVKWSEVARESIRNRLISMKNKSHASEIKILLDKETLSSISRISDEKAKKLYRNMVKEEWKHRKYSTQAR